MEFFKHMPNITFLSLPSPAGTTSPPISPLATSSSSGVPPHGPNKSPSSGSLTKFHNKVREEGSWIREVWSNLQTREGFRSWNSEWMKGKFVLFPVSSSYLFFFSPFEQITRTKTALNYHKFLSSFLLFLLPLFLLSFLFFFFPSNTYNKNIKGIPHIISTIISNKTQHTTQ